MNSQSSICAQTCTQFQARDFLHIIKQKDAWLIVQNSWKKKLQILHFIEQENGKFFECQITKAVQSKIVIFFTIKTRSF